MKFKLFGILIATFVVFAIISPVCALTKFGELSEYYIDYADVKQGATITSPSKIHPAEGGLEDLITPRGGMIFADGIEQREEFTIDLGQERKVGMFRFVMTGSTVYGGEIKRKPNMLRVEISTQSANGPWTEVYKLDPADVNESFALENVPARWIHVDLGVNTDGIGSRVHKLKIYKRYQLKSGPELMKEFHTQFRRDAPGLEEFWKAVDAEKWDEACDRLIEHFAKWPPEAKGQASPRVAAWMKNEVEEQGAVYKFDSSDWDWFRMKTECAHPSLGGLPGASSILQVLSSSYAATGDEAYAKQLAALLKDWIQDVPCPGVHRGQDGSIVNGWAGIVASQRTWSFGTIVHKIFPDNKNFDRDLKINVLYSFWEHVNFMKLVSAELGGNWLTNANSCMFEGAVHYPEFVQYKEWIEGSKSFLETSLTRDFFPCGREREDSSMYVPIATNQVTGQYLAMRKAGVPLSPEAQQQMEKVWDCYSRFVYPNLTQTSIGDAHRESPLTKQASAASPELVDIFGRQDLLYINSQGKKGKAPEQASNGCADCGWYTMRSPWETRPYTDARQMFFKASRHYGHGHPEQLSVTMYAYGRELLTDPGNPNYGTPIEPEVRRTAVHNTICVDGKNQEHTGGSQNVWAGVKGMDFVDAECVTYKDMVHRRQIAFLKSGKGAPDYWLIRDSVTGEGEHKYDLSFHFTEGAKPKMIGDAVCSTFDEGGNVMILSPNNSIKPAIIDAGIANTRELIPSNICRYSKEQAAPVKFETLVLPFKGTLTPKIKARYLAADPECTNADAVCIRVDSKSGSDFIVISSNPGTALSFDNGKIKTDAAVAVVRTDKKGKVIYSYNNTGTVAYKGKSVGGR